MNPARRVTNCPISQTLGRCPVARTPPRLTSDVRHQVIHQVITRSVTPKQVPAACQIKVPGNVERRSDEVTLDEVRLLKISF